MKRILLNESGTFYRINIVFCAELSKTNCRAELSNAELSCAELSRNPRKCYYQQRQLRVVSRSLTHQSTLTLVQAFVTRRIDCCSFLLVGPSCYLGLVGPSSPFTCPPCRKTAHAFFYHCLHARCITLAVHLLADTMSHQWDSLPVCPWLRLLLRL